MIRTGQEKRSVVVVGGGGGGGRRRRRKEDNQELGQECLTRACGSGSERCCVELCHLARLGRGSGGEVRRWERGSGGVMHPGTARERRGPRDPCEHIYI